MSGGKRGPAYAAHEANNAVWPSFLIPVLISDHLGSPTLELRARFSNVDGLWGVPVMPGSTPKRKYPACVFLSEVGGASFTGRLSANIGHSCGAGKFRVGNNFTSMKGWAFGNVLTY